MHINISGITANYRRRQVLHGIDWTVRSGVTGLLGPNGSGKTTLLSAIAGLYQPTKGSVTIHGTDRPRFGFVPQRFSIPGGVRLVDAISYTAWLSGVARDQRNAAARQALAAVDLTHEAHMKVKTLSDGQLRRAGIAAGLAQESDVLLLDEPSVGLDAEQRHRVRNLITEIGRSRPVVISTHLLEDVSYMCEHVGVLIQGRLVFDGTVAELETSGENQSTDARRSSVEAGYAQLLTVNAGIR